ncbi:MAG: hypothetical protein AAF907_09235 [Planctomycetota bacterium]
MAEPPDASPPFRLDRTAFRTFSSFEEENEVVKRERWAMTPQERLATTEMLRSLMYPDARTPPRLQRLFGVAQRRVR